MIYSKHSFCRPRVFLNYRKSLCLNLIPIVIMLALIIVHLPVAAQEIDSQRHTLNLVANNNEYKIIVSTPVGWSVTPQRFKNSRSLIDVDPGESRQASAQIQVYVEPRLDHADALKQMQEFASVVSDEDKVFTEIGGWAAVQITRLERREQPSQGRQHADPNVLRIQTYIAVGKALVVVAAGLPSDATPDIIETALAISSSLKFESAGDPGKAEEDLQLLQKPVSLEPALGSSRLASVSIGTALTELDAQVGSNERISTVGRGELEIAVSPDGVNVVVALQSSNWVSSQDGGATFSAPVAIGFGNGDPSVAYGQSGNFYQAGIDTNCGLGTPAYQNFNPPAGLAPFGYDCTGITRSVDNGVSFQTNTVNPAFICIAQTPPGNPAPDPANSCFPDQEHIAADRWNAGSGGDQVYSVWRDFPNGTTAGLVCSQDSGVNWTGRINLAAGNSRFPRITVGQDGFVYVAAYGGGFYRIWKFDSCANGLGLEPGFPKNVVARNPYDCPFPGHDRCDQNPSSQTVAVDDTDPDHIYYAYAADAGAASDSNVFVHDSLDGGENWPAARVVQVNTAIDARRIMPWMCTTGGDAVLTWYEQRDGDLSAANSDTTDHYGAHVGLNDLGDLEARAVFRISEVPDDWCASGWDCGTRVAPSASETCPAATQPQLAGFCGDNVAGTPDSGIRCDFSDEAATPGTYCPQPGPSGNNEICLAGNGCPKYGDYNGNACAGGKLFAAWPSATSPPGVLPPNTATNTGVLFDVINLDIPIPVITVPGGVNFADTCVGDTSFENLEICNTGGANLQVDVITSDNPNFAVTIPSSGFPVTISPDFCFPFQVAFSPSSIGPKSAVLTIPSNDTSRPTVEVTATGSGAEPNIGTAIADAGEFGNVCRGDFKDLDLTISNSGGCTLRVSNISSDSPAFTTAGVMSFPLVIAPYGSVAVPIRFEPSSLGSGSATITINSNDPDTPSKEVNFSGEALPGEVRVTGSTDFGDVCPGDLTEKTVNVCNVGPCNLNVTSASINCDDFTLINNPFPAPVSPASCLDLVVRFTPTSVGAKSCTLTINSDDPDSPTVDRTLTANTPLASIDVPPDQAFPPTVIQSVDACQSNQPFPVSNTGTCDLTITELSITDNAIEYSLSGLPSFPIILEPGHVAGEGALNTVFAPDGVNRALAGEVSVTYISEPITGTTTTVNRALCGEGVRTGARVLVTNGDVPIAMVKSIKLQRLGPKKNKNLLDTIDNARNLQLQTETPVSPCVMFQYHREYGTVSNPIQLAPGSYVVTVQARINGKQKKKTVGFDVSSCDFNPNIVVDF